MSILQQIENDFTKAVKAKNELVVLTLRLLKAALQNAEIAKRPEELSEGDYVKVIRSEIKKRSEAAEVYQKGGREELSRREQEEITVLKKYLPPEVSNEEVTEAVKRVIQEIGASGPKAFGAVMGKVMGELGGRVDGKRVGEMVKRFLN